MYINTYIVQKFEIALQPWCMAMAWPWMSSIHRGPGADQDSAGPQDLRVLIEYVDVNGEGELFFEDFVELIKQMRPKHIRVQNVQSLLQVTRGYKATYPMNWTSYSQPTGMKWHDISDFEPCPHAGGDGGCLVSPPEDWHFHRRSISSFWLLRFGPSAVTFWDLNL